MNTKKNKLSKLEIVHVNCDKLRSNSEDQVNLQLDLHWQAREVLLVT